MNIQSLSIVVPTGKCWNNCPFCVSRMHNEDYGTCVIPKGYGYIPQSYINRMKFVRENGCNTMMITGTAEPQQNMRFIETLLTENAKLPMPFYNIEFQTTGSNMTEEDIATLAQLGVTTISFSISSFDADRNWDMIGVPGQCRRLDLYELIAAARSAGLNVRASVNLTGEFADMLPHEFFEWGNKIKVDQITFRKIYADGDGPEAEWVKNHYYPADFYFDIQHYVEINGTPIARLPFGAIKYSVHGISTVVDGNCMAKDNIDDMKYAILRPNGKLYSRWDDTGSLIF